MNYKTFENVLVSPLPTGVIVDSGFVMKTGDSQYLFDENKIATFLNLSVEDVNNMTLSEINARARTVQGVSPDNVPLEKKILWLQKFHDEMCKLFNPKIVQKYINLMYWDNIYTYQTISDLNKDEYAPPAVGEFYYSKHKSFFDYKKKKIVSYNDNCWKVPYSIGTSVHGWILEGCIRETLPFMRDIKINSYLREFATIANELIFVTVAGKAIYVPLEILLKGDSHRIKESVVDYWTKHKTTWPDNSAAAIKHLESDEVKEFFAQIQTWKKGAK